MVIKIIFAIDDEEQAEFVSCKITNTVKLKRELLTIFHTIHTMSRNFLKS